MTKQHLFTPEDLAPSDKQILAEFPKPAESDSSSAARVALTEAQKGYREWGGQNSNQTVVNSVVSARRQIEGDTAYGPKEEADNEIALRTKAFTVGLMAERVFSKIWLSRAETVYAGNAVNPDEYKRRLDIRDVTSYFGGVQKETVITAWALALAELPENLKMTLEQAKLKDELAEERALEVLHTVQEINMNRNQFAEQWRRSFHKPPRAIPRTDELIKMACEQRFPSAEAELKYAQYLFRSTQKLTAHSWDKYFLRPENIQPETLQRMFKLPMASIYYDVTVPDAVLVTSAESPTIVGIVEFKAYEDESVRAWAKALTYVAGNSPEQVPFGKDSLLAYALSPDGKSMKQFGFNMRGEQNFLTMVKEMNKEAGLGTTEIDYPTILRLPADVSDSAIIELGRAFETNGYANFIIQRMPVKLAEIEVLAKSALKDAVKNMRLRTDLPDTEEIGLWGKRLTGRDVRILRKLADEWETV